MKKEKVIKVDDLLLLDLLKRIEFYVRRRSRFPIYQEVLDAMYFTLRSLGIKLTYSDYFVTVSFGSFSVTTKWD